MPVYDTYAWIEYFRGSEKGAVVKRLLESQEGYTPSIVLAEAARKYRREGFSEDDILKRLLFHCWQDGSSNNRYRDIAESL